MTNAKNVYALMLALVIVLSGCFGNTTTEIGMYVTYRGTAVAGTGDVTVA